MTYWIVWVYTGKPHRRKKLDSYLDRGQAYAVRGALLRLGYRVTVEEVTI